MQYDTRDNDTWSELLPDSACEGNNEGGSVCGGDNGDVVICWFSAAEEAFFFAKILNNDMFLF